MSEKRRNRRKYERDLVKMTDGRVAQDRRYLARLVEAGATIHEVYRELTQGMGYEQVDAAKIAGELFKTNKNKNDD